MTSFFKRAALALIILPISVACQTKTTDSKTQEKATAPSTATADKKSDDKKASADAKSDKPQTVCEKYASAVCEKIGVQTPECAALSTASKLLTEAACKEANKGVDYAVAQFQESRKECDTLVKKLCEDIGPKTQTCDMVTTMTATFPTERCSMMLEQYDQVVADLKRREEANKPLSAEKQKALTAGNAPSFGSKKAKVTLVEFSDFECPYCSKAADTVNQIKKKYADKVHFIFRQFPLSFHKNAQVAAEASLAANAQGKFWQYHDLLFENQQKLDRKSLDEYAKKIGLNMKKFKKALDNKTFEATVKSDLKLGELAAVSGTPSLFINGERVQNPTDFNAIDKLITEKLAN